MSKISPVQLWIGGNGGNGGGARYPVELDRHALEADLTRELEGAVHFDGGTRALYANDGSNYRQVPIGWSFRGMSRT